MEIPQSDKNQIEIECKIFITKIKMMFLKVKFNFFEH